MKLIAVTDGRHPINELALKIISIKDSVDYIHIREKSKTASELITLLEILKKGCIPSEQLVIHDRVDIALCQNIPNVQLPSHGIPIKAVRRHFPHLKIGASIHMIDEAVKAENDGADYVIFGHCFDTMCKQGKPPNGIGNISKIKDVLRIPVYAIGGITAERAGLIRKTNADGIAIMSGIFSASRPLEAAREYQMICIGGV